jgi:arginyl-tRNA synthetase
MKNYLKDIITAALAQVAGSAENLPDIIIEKPRIPEHGDAATNVALAAAKALGKPPRQIAESIVNAIEIDHKFLASIEIAGPGFINFRFADGWIHTKLNDIVNNLENYGKTDANRGKRMQVEFVSANPTGPLTVGHGRNAVLGDTIARMYEWTGANVEREYYFNDAGRQMRVLGESVQVRYQQLLGDQVELRDGYYEGEYIRDIAQVLLDRIGDRLKGSDNIEEFTAAARDAMFDDIKGTLERMQIRMDTFFNEHSLYENGSIDAVVQRLRDKGLAYDSEGATWFKTTEFGKEKDTVLIKSTGEPTYRLPDIAYHIEKLERGFDLCVDIFGADHIATYPDVLSALEALGYDSKRVSVMVYQFVTIVKDGQPFKMSTRKANFVTLDELMDEVGADVSRFFFLMRAPGTHLEFDIDQAKDASDKNPVYYLQYANARVKSILRKADEVMPDISTSPNLSLLTHDAETQLIKILLDFPETVQKSAEAMEPHRIITYLNDVAATFTQFYHHCRIIGEDDTVAAARIALLKATSAVLVNGLTILGISAPERM